MLCARMSTRAPHRLLNKKKSVRREEQANRLNRLLYMVCHIAAACESHYVYVTHFRRCSFEDACLLLHGRRYPRNEMRTHKDLSHLVGRVSSKTLEKHLKEKKKKMREKNCITGWLVELHIGINLIRSLR